MSSKRFCDMGIPSQFFQNGIKMMEDKLQHYGILGMKWGIRRYQNPDGTLTKAGRIRAQEREDAVRKEMANNIDKVNINVSAIKQASNSFNELGTELGNEYDALYKKLQSDSGFKEKIFGELYKDLGKGCDDPELFDLAVSEAMSSAIDSSIPSSMKEKQAAFWKAGDDYFSEVSKATTSILNTVGSKFIKDLDSERSQQIAAQVFSKTTAGEELSWNAYMYRHFHDYWVDDVESRYQLQDSLNVEDYNKWARNQ